MNKKFVKFGDIKIEKRRIHRYKYPFFFEKDVGIGNILISNKISSGEKSYESTLLVKWMMIIKLNY